MLITAKLTNTVTGGLIKVAGFQYQAPADKLGASIMLALSNPLDGGLPLGDALKFEIGVALMGTIPPAWSWVTVIQGGRIAGRAARTSLLEGKGRGNPGDTLQISGLNTLADRWTLAPMRPVVMVDPQKIDPASLQASPQDCPIDLETGETIVPVIEAIDGLNLYQILARAYLGTYPLLHAPSTGGHWAGTLAAGTGCGFSNFVTNLPNYPVDRADFTLQSGWHGGASGAYAFFNPIFYEDNNVLYIWDVDRGLPAGYSPHTLALKCMVTFDEGTSPEEITNALLLTYRIPAPIQNEVFIPGGIPNAIPGFRFEHEVTAEGGTPNQPGYYRQEVTRRIIEYKDLTTGEVVFSAETEIETLNYAWRLSVSREVLISRQVMQIFYQGKLKQGHSMTMEATYPNPSVEKNPDIFGEVLTETCQMEWTADLNNPGESILKFCKTETAGVVLVEEALELKEGETEKKKTYTPIMDAARGSGIILDLDKQEEAGVKQYTSNRPLKAVIERLRVTGANQAQVETTQIDQITGTPYPPVTISRAGSISTAGGRRGQSRAQAQNTRTELIKDSVSIAKYGFRRAQELDVANLPQGEARALAVRRLYRIANPRRGVTIELPGVDLSIRRGSIVRAFMRSGGYVTAIITGFTITGKALGVPGQQNISMVLEGIEV